MTVNSRPSRDRTTPTMEIIVSANTIRGGVSHPPVLAHMFYRSKITALQDCTGTCVMCVGACELYCKDKFAVLTTERLPWLQTS